MLCSNIAHCDFLHFSLIMLIHNECNMAICTHLNIFAFLMCVYILEGVQQQENSVRDGNGVDRYFIKPVICFCFFLHIQLFIYNCFLVSSLSFCGISWRARKLLMDNDLTEYSRKSNSVTSFVSWLKSSFIDQRRMKENKRAHERELAA